MNRVRTISAFIAACFIISIFGCDDLECAQQSGTDLTTVCAAHDGAGSHSKSSAHGHVHDCLCVCHVPSILTSIALPEPIPSVGTAVHPYLSRAIAAPRRAIFHPPLAS